MSIGHVERIHVAPDSGEPMEQRQYATAVAGTGLRGDRYFDDNGLWSYLDQDPNRDHAEASDVTFIEAEVLDAIERDAGIDLPPGTHRRNVTTRNVALNHLVGQQFTVGDVVCEGIQLCEPCGYLQSLVDEPSITDALVHRGGLNARIVESGVFGVDAEVRW